MILNTVEAGGAGLPVVLLHGLFGAARNFGGIQKRLATRARVLALDLRNHGDSPHAFGSGYAPQAADVLETLRARDALPCVLVGHSMGGKVAMRAALDRPDAVARLLVSDIAPVPYRPAFRGYADAMRSIPLSPELSRAAADAALSAVVPEAGIRGFLLQNLRFGQAPGWRIGLEEIATGLPEIEGWEAGEGDRYDGPTLFVAGARSDHIRAEHRPVIRALFPAARFATVKDAGHWVHADNPEGFLSVLDAFLPG
jgi:pimeloyl-ACP methyl ester carboxylesterase